MDIKVRIAILEHALRWASAILVEAVDNHADHLPLEIRQSLWAATEALSEAAYDIENKLDRDGRPY